MKKNKPLPDFVSGLGDSGRATADLAVMAVDNDPQRFRHLLDVCFAEQYPMSMRASRVAQLCCEKNPALIVPYLNEVIDKIAASSIPGVRRNFLKVLIEFIDIELVKDNGILAGLCFDLIADGSEPVALRYYGMVYLHKLSFLIPELASELTAILERNLETEESEGMKKRSLEIIHSIKG